MIESNLKILLAEKEVSLIQTAKDTGINKDTLITIKNGKAKGISATTLNILCKYFECSVGDLLSVKKDEGNPVPFINEKGKNQ